MWSKPQTQTEPPAPPPMQLPPSNAASFNAPPSRSTTPASPASRSSARLGSSLQIKGQITGTEDLQLDCVVDGPISLQGHQLTVGSSAQLKSEIHAGEVVVSGKVVGNVHAQGRVDIKAEGSITGDIACARISIEDGAHFKGRIEIDPGKSQARG